MTRHEAIVRKLAETTLGGTRFTALIRRWEMNVEPPPPEVKEEGATAEEKYAHFLYTTLKLSSNQLFSRPFNGIKWGQPRGLNKDEERYFSEDGPDEDDEPIQLFSSPHIATKTTNINSLKRKRMAGSTGLRASPRSQHMMLPRTPPIGSLVDYGEEDDEDLASLNGVEDLAGLVGRRKGVTGSPAGPPATPRLTHRRINSSSDVFEPLPTPDDEDEEDTLLESLISKSGPSITLKQAPPKPPSEAFDIGGLRAGDKRRREDDEDDGMFERLATKSKRQSTRTGETSPSGVKPTGGVGGEEGGGGPKKIKLKFGAAGIAAAAAPQTSPVPSETGAKDGDNG